MTFVPNYMGPPPSVPGRGGLIAFGIVSIVLGCFAGCLALIMPLALLASRMAPRSAGSANPGMIGFTMLFYAGIAAGFLWIGIGSCRCQRWVRPVVLCLAWPWMIVGLISSFIVVPALATNVPAAGTTGAPAMPPQVRAVMLLVVGGMLAIMYVILPLAYIAFYQRQRTKEVLAECDPKPRWTDGCPTPALGLALWSAITGLGILSMLQFACIPLFGTYLAGVPAAIVIVALSVAMIAAAWMCYHLRPAGWWTTLVAITLWTSSTFITFEAVGLMDFYRHSNMSDEQLALLEKQPIVHSPVMPFMVLAFGVVCIGYLLYVRRFFFPPDAQPDRASASAGT